MLTVNTMDAGRSYRVISLIDGVSQADSAAAAKNRALAAMVKKAQSIPADAIVNIRYTNSSAILYHWGIREYHTVIVSGTAVRFI